MISHSVFGTLVLLSVAALAVAPVEKNVCSLHSSVHLYLDGSYSTWWVGLQRGSKAYRLSDPPGTVMSALMPTEPALQKPFYGTNLKTMLQNQTLVDMFNKPWYYTISFPSPEGSSGCRATLTMKGINYRASSVELNHQPILSRTGNVVGSLRYFDFDVDELSDQNTLSVRLHRPHDWPMEPNSTDLEMPFLDWNPEAPDGNLGIWRDIELTVFPPVPVSVRYPVVNLLNLPTANDRCEVEFLVEVYNSDPVNSYEGQVQILLEWNSPVRNKLPQREQSIVVSLPPHSGSNVAMNFSVSSCSELLWWPWQMQQKAIGSKEIGQFYRGTLHNVTASFLTLENKITDSNLPPTVSDSVNLRFGLRTVEKKNIPVGKGFEPSPSAPNMTSAGLFFVNGRRLMVRGGGFASDLFLRRKGVPVNFEKHVQLVQQLGLNAIRLEGQFVDDALFDYADEYGVLVIPGIVCCDAWQHWNLWGPEQLVVAMDSVRSQVKRLRIHPSIFFFLLSSDELPPLNVETSYRKILNEEQWSNPIMSSAGSWVSLISGQSGAKMTGPYAWIPPNYWTNAEAKRSYGGASGFIAETSPGASVLTIESIQKIIPETRLWNKNSTEPNDYWSWHAGSETGRFNTLSWFTPALEARLGASYSADEYACKSQFMVYESHRAMMEAYSMNKYGGGSDEFASTGIVQWMLNSAWPSNIWHLYDYFGVGGGAFYGTKKATAYPLHLAFDYTSLGVKLINSGYESFAGNALEAAVSLYRASDGKQLRSQQLSLPPTIDPDSSIELLNALPRDWLGHHNGTLLLRLALTSADSDREGIFDVGTYALPSMTRSNDIVNYTSCNYFRCNLTSFADFTDLQDLPSVTVNVEAVLAGPDTLSVTLENPHFDRVAFFLNIASVAMSNGETFLDLVWSDNYFILLPEERRTVFANLPNPATRSGDVAAVKEVKLRVINNCTGGEKKI